MEVSGLAKIRLEWLAENESEHLHELLQTNQLHQLEKVLDQTNLQAAYVIRKARQGGMTEREAYQYAIEAVVAPGDGRANMEDPARKPLPLKEKMEIYRRLIARAEAQQRAQSLKNRQT